VADGLTEETEETVITQSTFAARLGDLESARALVNGAANVNDTAADGASALAVAILSGHPAVASFLVEQT